MGKKYIIGNLLAETAKIKQMWNENPTFAIPKPKPDSPTITQAEHAALGATLATQEAEIESVRAHLAGLIQARDETADQIDGWNVRLRRGVGFVFGLESPQYKQVGGTPPSERKPTGPKPKSTTP